MTGSVPLVRLSGRVCPQRTTDVSHRVRTLRDARRWEGRVGIAKSNVIDLTCQFEIIRG